MFVILEFRKKTYPKEYWELYEVYDEIVRYLNNRYGCEVANVSLDVIEIGSSNNRAFEENLMAEVSINHLPRLVINLSEKCLNEGKIFLKTILSHEFGHIIKKHYINHENGDRDINQEFEADLFASEFVGTKHVLKFLETLKAKNVNDENSIIEYESRIKHIKGKQV